MGKEKATFAAGCFWGVQKVFDETPGVIETSVGYTGGEEENPSYEEVCTGTTGHAEAIEIIFDSEQVSFKNLLKVFWKIHDPTQGNKQGLDSGTQYRSSIFCHSDQQKGQAEHSLQQEQKKYEKKITTSLTKASAFYKAEKYHQKYYIGHPGVC